MPTMPVDRHGTQLALGQRVRVQHCVGPYGQVRIDEGTITYLDHFGVTLDAKTWVCVERTGFHEHHDFEHGHVAFTEVLPLAA